jgi:N-acyl-D-amino-acid deacylase
VYHPSILGEPHNVLAVREQLELSRQTGVRLQLAHLLFHGRNTWPTYSIVLRDIERAAEDGLDVAFDSYAHTFGNTTIGVNFPNWFLDGLADNINDPLCLERVRDEMEHQFECLGRGYRDIMLMGGAGVPELVELERLDFAAIADRLGMSEFDAYAHVARASEGRAYIRQYTYSGEADGEDEEPLRAVIAHPLCAINTDASVPAPGTGQVNPAAYGTYPRLLGRYSRDLKLFSLEEIVRRMTSFSAEQLGLAGVGTIEVGRWADLTLFDPETVDDHTTLDQPDAPPDGIEAVLISGRVVVRNGKMVTRQRHGRVLRR